MSGLLEKAGKRPSRKRRGRGPGSGLGKTSGRGQKGAASRSGFKKNLAYEGGQVPILRRLPKRGFSNFPFRRRYDVVNVSDLERLFESGEDVALGTLAARGALDPRYGRLKVLGGGDLTKSLRVVAEAVSESARKKIEAAGGSVEVVGPPRKKRRRGRGRGVSKRKEAGGPKESSGGAAEAGKGGGEKSRDRKE
ncbi:MAG: 50S ribosomal protein L15 [Planctomycetota bacterium]